MSILLATNEATDFGPVATVVTTAGRFDSDYVSNGILIPDNQSSVTTPQWGAGGTDDVWIHFKSYLTVLGSAQDGAMWFFYDVGESEILRFEMVNGNVSLQLQGSGGTTTGSSHAIGSGFLHDIDIHINLSGGSFTATFYLNAGVVTTVTRAAGTYTLPRRLMVGGFDYGGHTLSEFFVSDTTTIGRHLRQIAPASQGNYNLWTGGFTELADTDLLTVASSNVIGQRESSVAATWTGPTTGAIEEVVLTSSALKNGVSGPQSLSQFLRISSTDFDETAILLEDSTQLIIDTWSVNPSTTNNWAFADLTAIEMGLLSVA